MSSASIPLLTILAGLTIISCSIFPRSVENLSGNDIVATASPEAENASALPVAGSEASFSYGSTRSVVRPRSYLDATVEPCAPLVGINPDPCRKRTSPGEYDIADKYALVQVERERIVREHASSLEEDMVNRSLNGPGRSYTDSPHFVVRGVFLPGTTRCNFTHFKVSNSTVIADEVRGDRSMRLSETPWVTTCVTDLSVREYMVGDGPENLTIVTETLPAIYIVRDYFDRLDEDLTDELQRSGLIEDVVASHEGFEVILWVTPPSNVAVKAWDMTGWWDVLRDGEEIKSVHRSVKWFRDTPENRAVLIYAVDDYRQKVKAAHSNITSMHEGRIGKHEDLPLLLIDANDEFFEAHIAAEGAYDDPDVVSPVELLLPADE